MSSPIKTLCLFMSFFGFWLLLNVFAQEKTSTIDFQPQKGWQINGPLNVRSDGRMSLTQNGKGLAWKPVELNIDEFPILLVRAGNSLPRERWLIAVERGHLPSFSQNENILLIDNFALEGGFIIPFKKITGWKGRVKFTLQIVVEGQKGDCIEFDALEAARMSDVNPALPKLSAPATGASISPVGLHYCWFEASNAVEYELQVSRNKDFSRAKSFRVTPQYLTDRLSFLPEDKELLQPGNWFWRVQGINISTRSGRWSDTGTFSVREQAQRLMPPALDISAVHPLILLFSDEQHLVKNWKSLPDELRPYTAFRIEALPVENLLRVIKKAQKNNIPVIVQTSGPHDDYGRMSSRITLSEIEQILQELPAVKGIYICEQGFRVFPPRNRIMMDYAERLIRLAAEYGKLIVWADGHWGRNLWIDVGLNKKLMTTIQKYRKYFIPLWKMNCSLTPYSIHSTLLGFWIGGAVDNWGVQPERWYWYEAGFGKLGQQAWFKEGEMAEFPPTFYGQMMLLGLSSGASVYSFEPSSDIWAEDGTLSQISRQITFPLLALIIRNKLIPSQEQILKKIQRVYVADNPDSAWALDYGILHYLYKEMYGIEHPFQMISSSSRYFWLPILSKWISPEILKSFPEELRASQFFSDEEVREYLDKWPVSQIKGDAWIIQLEDTVLIMNSRENWDISQTFEVPLSGKINKIAGSLGVNSYFLAHESKAELLIHLNGRIGKTQTLKLWTQSEPQELSVTPESALVSSSWEITEKCLLLKFWLTQEAINVKIRFSGTER